MVVWFPFLLHEIYCSFLLIICNGLANNIHFIGQVFEFYGLLSRQIVSWNKSFISFSKPILATHKCSLLQFIGMPLGSFHFVYLGIPLFQVALKPIHLYRIANRILESIAAWKGSTLSFEVLEFVFLNSHVLDVKMHVFSFFQVVS